MFEPSQPYDNNDDIDKAQVSDNRCDIEPDLLIRLERLDVKTEVVLAYNVSLVCMYVCMCMSMRVYGNSRIQARRSRSTNSKVICIYGFHISVRIYDDHGQNAKTQNVRICIVLVRRVSGPGQTGRSIRQVAVGKLTV